jgi:uncharacterized membrane protein
MPKAAGNGSARQRVDPAADNIQAIIDLERQAAREATLAERAGERISDFVGSMTFVIVHSSLLAAWMVWNGWVAPGLRFDPYPYLLLTFIVSLEGVLIATFVLMAQNRMSRQTEQRAHLNLQVDLLAEQEMTLVLKMLRRIAEHLEVPPEDGDQARTEKLAEQTNVYDLVRTLREELPEKDK